MKGYVMLQDGTIYSGEVIGTRQNVLGALSLTSDGTLTVQCGKTGCTAVVSPEAGQNNGIVLTPTDHAKLLKKTADTPTILGKVVADQLPKEFHLYDLKTVL